MNRPDEQRCSHLNPSPPSPDLTCADLRSFSSPVGPTQADLGPDVLPRLVSLTCPETVDVSLTFGSSLFVSDHVWKRAAARRRGYASRPRPPLLRAKADGQAWLDTHLILLFLLPLRSVFPSASTFPLRSVS